MNAFYLLSLTIYTFGVYASGMMLVFRLRDRSPCARVERVDAGVRAAGRRIDLALIATCALWFLTALLALVGRSIEGLDVWPVESVHLMLAFLFPPLIMHSVFLDCGGALRLTSPVWRLYLPLYAVGQALGAYCLLGFFGRVPQVAGMAFGALSGVAIGGSFAVAAVYSMTAVQITRRARESRRERSSRLGSLVLFVAVLGLTAVFVASELAGGPDIGTVFRLLMSSMPLAFFFVGTWTENRFGFYDLFVKRGLSFLVTLVTLVAVYALAAPVLDRVPRSVGPWIHAIVLLPLALALPWLNRSLGRFLDGWWLGRSYGAGEAVQLFLTETRRAASEGELIDAAERALTTIFRAPARVVLEPLAARAMRFDARIEVPILLDGRREGVILLGPRESQAPYFSGDRVVLESLADLLGALRDAVRQQQRRLEQEQRVRDISLQASRSELKALRAQINPHFLFNALNAIAGLIHRDPELADSTVERLSEVFRYTLRRSETEWVVLEDELEFVQAYLDVERARFGARLQVVVRADDDAAATRVPAMLVQTLVENAVKHGVARVVGPARIEVDARLSDGSLIVEVADSGPGFDSREQAVDRSARRAGAGFGLDSVRRRLAGHFGDDATLDIDRDGAAGMTRVRIALPRGGPAAAADADSDGGGAMAS